MTDALGQVRRAAQGRQAASDRLRAAIVAARAMDHTHQEIADAAGLTKQRIGQILSEEK